MGLVSKLLLGHVRLAGDVKRHPNCDRQITVKGQPQGQSIGESDRSPGDTNPFSLSIG